MDFTLVISFGLVMLVWFMGYISGRVDAAVKLERAKNEETKSKFTGIFTERD